MIEPDVLAGIVRAVAIAEDRAISPLIQKFRADYPGVLISTCLDDEVCGTDPIAATPGINLYLLTNSNNGCQKLTRDPMVANGIVLAEVEEG